MRGRGLWVGLVADRGVFGALFFCAILFIFVFFALYFPFILCLCLVVGGGE